LPPSCGMMKPKPLVVLNHLTVPIAIICVTLRQTHRATGAMLVDNLPFGRLEGTRRTEAQQAKPKRDCVPQLAQKRRMLSITVARH
jgi:hypothetical protein